MNSICENRGIQILCMKSVCHDHINIIVTNQNIILASLGNAYEPCL